MKFDNTYINISDKFYKKACAKKFKNPRLSLFNESLADDLNLDFKKFNPQQLALFMCGNELFPDSKPCALAYAGHQFGHFVPVLGDGRALLLGEIINKKGEKFDLQLKGSGQTHFSRRGDGLAALGPMIREYIVSEAMHALGIKTTRSLSVVTTGECVNRRSLVPGAVLARLASSHIRIGTFEYFFNLKDFETLKLLTDYTIQRHYPELVKSESRVIYFLQSFMEKQIDLVCEWMRVGFIHGVMNTDNCALSGETIDFGPCAFMDEYVHDKVFSSIDSYGRYAFSAQPQIALWNFTKLAKSVSFLISDQESIAHEKINEFQNNFEHIFKHKYSQMMCQKIGLFEFKNDDLNLIEKLLSIMEDEELDYTLTFRFLMTFLDPIQYPKCYDFVLSSQLRDWIEIWKNRLKNQIQTLNDALILMSRFNPIYIPRNHIIESIIHDAENKDDFSSAYEFTEALSEPYKYKPELEKFCLPPRYEQRVDKTFCGT